MEKLGGPVIAPDDITVVQSHIRTKKPAGTNLSLARNRLFLPLQRTELILIYENYKGVVALSGPVVKKVIVK